MTDPDPEEAARQTQTARARWLDPVWHRAVRDWTEARLAGLGIDITGPVSQPHIRPWSTALSVPTSAGRVWLKASGPGTIHEAALVDAMVRWQTSGIVEPFAVEPTRGWILMPDGGARLRDMTGGGPRLDHWARILRQWAAIQRGLADRAGDLVAIGVPDLRPAKLPDVLAALTEDPEAIVADDDRARLHELIPTYARWCAELDAMGIAPSLQHDDLHDGNVFVGASGDRIFDWGDSSVAHPFGTLLVTFRSVANRGLGNAKAQALALDRLRDVYLEAWTDMQPIAQLRRAADLAMRTAIVGRALSWKRALSGIPLDDRGEWAGAIGGWLMDLFEPDLV